MEQLLEIKRISKMVSIPNLRNITNAMMTNDDSVVHSRSGQHSVMGDRGSNQTMMSMGQTTMSESQTTMSDSQTTMSEGQTIMMTEDGSMTNSWDAVGSVADHWSGEMGTSNVGYNRF